jgi:hypothetical protein
VGGGKKVQLLLFLNLCNRLRQSQLRFTPRERTLVPVVQWRKKLEYNGTAHQLFIDFRKAYDSVKREVLYNILTEFGLPRKLVGLIKICLNETYSTAHNKQISV